MMLLINVLQPIECQVRIHLRGRNIGVSKDRLYGSQVGAIFYHVGGATVAQHMRTCIATGADGSGTHHLPDSLPSQLSRTAAEK